MKYEEIKERNPEFFKDPLRENVIDETFSINRYFFDNELDEDEFIVAMLEKHNLVYDGIVIIKKFEMLQFRKPKRSTLSPQFIFPQQ